MLFIVDISAVLLILSSKFLVLSTVYYYNLELLQVLVAFDKHQLLKVVITQVEPVSQDRRFSHHQTKMKFQLKKSGNQIELPIKLAIIPVWLSSLLVPEPPFGI